MKLLSPVPLLLVTSALAAGCRSADKSAADGSGLTWAHGPAQNIVGSPVGYLESLKAGNAVGYSAVNVCVETGKPKISDQALLLEVKLAYAAWLKASGSYGADDWAKFRFAPSASCATDDKAFQAMVKLDDFSKQQSGEDYAKLFNQPTITCQKTGFGGGSCSGNGITLGWGGVGAVSLYGNQLSNYQPASTQLSPYVDWISLKDDVAGNAKLDSQTKTDVGTQYDALLAAGEPKWDDLVRFNALLSAKQLQNGEDAGFRDAMETLLNGSQSTANYRPKEAEMHVLLHEVGHQFGMEHADNPDGDSVTGNAGDATKDANGQWVTKLSVMAYALPYAYLTADDVAGAAAAGAAVRQALGAP